MKLIVFIPLLLLGTILQAQEVEEIQTNTDYKGRQCRHAGAIPCNIIIKNGGNTNISLLENVLTFKVHRDRITQEIETAILEKILKVEGTNIYILDDTFVLSEDLAEALKLGKEIKIPAGEYPVKITKEFVEIAFRIDMK